MSCLARLECAEALIGQFNNLPRSIGDDRLKVWVHSPHDFRVLGARVRPCLRVID